MQTWLVMRTLSVCPSVKHVICDKTKESCACILWEKESLVGVDPFYLKVWVNWPLWIEITDFQSIFHRSASAVAPCKKSSINNRKSKTRFLMSLRWTSYVAPEAPKGAQQDAQLSQRDLAAGYISFGRKWKTGTGRQYFTDLIGLSSTTVTQSPSKAIEFGKKCKIRAITPFKIIQGDQDLYIQGESPYATSYKWLLIVTDSLTSYRYISRTRNSSAVTPSEKSSINTNRKCFECFPMSPRWTSDIVPKSPKGAQKRSVQNLNCDNSETVRNWMSVGINH